MTKRLSFLIAVSSALAFLAAERNALAQVFAYDDASAYTNWTDGSNLGFGFQPWALQQDNGASGVGNQGFAGFLLSGSGGIDTAGKSFAAFANGDGNVYATAYRSFSNALTTNVLFKFKFQNTGISSGGLMGFALRSSASMSITNSDGIFDADTRFALYFLGGHTDYLVWDGNGVVDTGIPFTYDGLSIAFNLVSADTYLLVIRSADGFTAITNYTGQLAGTQGAAVATFAGFNQNSGPFENAFFNSFQISSVTIVPPDILNLHPMNKGIFISTPDQLSFDVTSLFSTVAGSNVSLVLNGVNQTSFTFTGSGTTNLHIVLNPPLQDNLVYSGTIVAQDANGNRATNTFSFNTWDPNDAFVEAADYNFGGGFWDDNFVDPAPNTYYQDLIGINGIDYLEYDLTGANPTNVWRPGDLPQIELATNVDNGIFFLGTGSQPCDLGFVENGEWLNYTRRLSNVTYNVYARMAGFGANPTMLMERLASPLATSSNQPRASLGTFVCPETGGVQSWTFVPLNDFFSNPVLIRFPTTNTFRLSCVGSSGSYNMAYLILVPSTNQSATLRPYLSAGYPYPGASGVGPDQNISFTIANRQTTNVPGDVKLFLNSSDVTTGLVFSNNAAGTLVSYHPASLLPAGTNTLLVIFGDGAVSQTNQWQFVVATLPVIPAAYAVATNQAGSPGFAVQIAKAPDNSLVTDFPNTIARALLQVAGLLTNSNTGQPYTNLAAGPNGNGTYSETNTINYDITGLPTGNYTFTNKSALPYIPARGTNNFIAMTATMYLQLSPGVYTFAVRSDDGFELTTGPAPTSSNLVLGIFDGGRGDYFPSTFDFIVQTNGLYPMRLVFEQGQFGGNIEFYSINRTNGVAFLINGQANGGGIKSFRSLLSAPSLVLLNPAHSGHTTTFSLQTLASYTHNVQYKDALTATNWSALTSFIGNGSITNVSDTTATNAQRFYRVVATP